MSDLEPMLRSVARGLTTEPPATDVVEAVMTRVSVARVPRRTLVSRLRHRMGLVLAVVVALLVTTLAVSPVGATVAEWFGFHGVMVRDGRPVDGDPEVPAEEPGMSLAEAGDRVGFEPLVPAELGSPDGVGVSPNRRVLSLSWGSGGETIRLDEFADGLDPAFWKTATDATRVDVAGTDGLWFPSPHHVVVQSGGEPEVVPARTAGPTLVWVVGERTLRLEGDLTLERAQRIATTMR